MYLYLCSVSIHPLIKGFFGLLSIVYFNKYGINNKHLYNKNIYQYEVSLYKQNCVMIPLKVQDI